MDEKTIKYGRIRITEEWKEIRVMKMNKGRKK